MDTHVRKKDLSVLYTNDPVVVDNSINTLEQLLVENDEYKVVGFDLEYTVGRARHDRMVSLAQLCMRHRALIYHYCLSTRPCERFTRFLNSPDYKYATVDTTNDLKVLKSSGISSQKLVSIEG
ncbi:hypothetical protein D1007_24137 [Hordeum vulgare]|nr:hypothetical protein D1007_24137 [Hordeum vulgare]